MAEEGTKKFWKAEPLLGGVALLVLMVGCFFVLRPFFSALMWATILAYSLYPLQKRFTRWFRGSRTWAACLVSLTVMVVFAGPVVLIGVSLAQDGRDLAVATRNWFLAAPEQAPPWIAQAPIVGDELEEYWADFSDGRKRWIEQLDKQVKSPLQPKVGIEEGDGAVVVDPPLPLQSEPVEASRRGDSPHLVVLLGRFLSGARSWLISIGLAVGQGVTQVVVSAFLTFFLLRDAPELGKRLGVAVQRLAGDRGRHLIEVASDTVSGVIYGILGTALIQSVVAGVGFWIAGVPGAVLLSVLTFFFAVVPFGPPLVWGPAALWLFAQDKPGMALFMLLWGLLGISSVDNLLRPLLISQGSKMPFALIFCGVIGGALSFGLVGVFLGPTMLAVAFRLIEEWSSGPAGLDEESSLHGISELPDGPGSSRPTHGGESLGVG